MKEHFAVVEGAKRYLFVQKYQIEKITKKHQKVNIAFSKRYAACKHFVPRAAINI